MQRDRCKDLTLSVRLIPPVQFRPLSTVGTVRLDYRVVQQQYPVPAQGSLSAIAGRQIADMAAGPHNGRMRFLFLFLTVAWVLGWGSARSEALEQPRMKPAPVEPPQSELITSVSVTDARDLLTEAGAGVEKVDFSADGFTITAALSPERHIFFDGMNCQGEAGAKTCTEFKISSAWDVRSSARAAALAKQLNYNWTSVHADGATLDLWRMDFTYGGITRAHLRDIVHEFLDLRQQAEDEIWPPAAGGRPR